MGAQGRSPYIQAHFFQLLNFFSTLQLGRPFTHQQEASLERQHCICMDFKLFLMKQLQQHIQCITGLAQLWYFFNDFKNQFKVAEHSFCSLCVQWNPINIGHHWAKKIGPINGVAILTRVFLHENVWQFLSGGRKAGFHCRCHLPNRDKRKVAAHKLKLGK